MGNLSEGTCITILKQAGVNRRQALQNELAVGLGLFTASGLVNADTKEAFRVCYEESGYQCKAGERDYKTVNRRVNATGLLFEKIGLDELLTWVGETGEEEMVMKIAVGIKGLDLCSIDSVLEYCGRARLKAVPVPIKSPEPQDGAGGDEKKQPEEETVAAIKIHSGHLHLTVPAEATETELVILAQKILKLAAKREVKKAA